MLYSFISSSTFLKISFKEQYFFYSSHLLYLLCLFFFCFIALVTTLSTVLNRNHNSGHFFWILMGKHSVFNRVCDVSHRLFINVLCHIEEVSFVLCWVFLLWMGIKFCQMLFLLLEIGMWFFFYCLLIWFIYWFCWLYYIALISVVLL